MLYLIQWGDNMAYSSNFQKGLMMGLAMNGLPVSDNQSGSYEPYVLPIASSISVVYIFSSSAMFGLPFFRHC